MKNHLYKLSVILTDQLLDTLQIVIGVISHHQFAAFFCRININLCSQSAFQLLLQVFDENIFFRTYRLCGNRLF